MGVQVGASRRWWRMWSLVLAVALLAPLAVVAPPPAAAQDGPPLPRGERIATIPWVDDAPAVDIYMHREGDRVQFTGEILHPPTTECLLIHPFGEYTVTYGIWQVVFDWHQRTREAGARVVGGGPAPPFVDQDDDANENGVARFREDVVIAPGEVFWAEYEIEPDVDWETLSFYLDGTAQTSGSPTCGRAQPRRYASFGPSDRVGLGGSWLPIDGVAGRAVPAGDTVPVRLRLDNETDDELTDVSVDSVTVVSLDGDGKASLVRDTSPEAQRPAPVLAASGPSSVTFDDHLLTGEVAGTVELVAELSATDPDGQPVVGTVRDEFEIRRVGMRVEVVPPEDPVVLLDAADGGGFEPAEVDLVVRVSVPDDEEALVDVGPFEVVEGDGGLSLRVLERTDDGWQEVSPPPVPLPIEVIEGPTPVPVERIEPGESADLDVRVRVTEPAGYRVRATLEGFAEGSGERVLGRGDGTFAVVEDSLLRLELELDPNPVELEPSEGDEPDEPEPVTVTARVVNDSVRTAFDTVSVPELELVLPVEDGEEIVIARVVDGPIVDGGATDLGPLGPGESSPEVTWTLGAIEQGKAEVVARATGTGSRGEVEIEATETLEVRGPIVVIDLAPRGVATRPDGSQWALGGQSWRLEGTVANDSSDETVVVWLDPRFEGNASLGPVTSATHQLPPMDEQCPVMPTLVLDPGDEVQLTVPVRASRVLGIEDSKVSLEPRLHVEAIDGELLDAPVVVDESRWSARRDGVRFDGEIAYPMPVETGRLEVDRDGWELSYLVTATTLEHLGEFFRDTAALAHGAAEVSVLLSPAVGPYLDTEVVGQFNVVAQFLHNVVWQMTYEERFELAEQVSDQVYAATRGLIDDPELRAQIWNTVWGTISDWAADEWQNFEEDRYYDGDLDAILTRLGAFAGSNPDLAVGAAASGLSTLCKIGNNSPMILRSLDRVKALRGEALARWNGTLVASHFLEPGLEVGYRLARQAFGIDRYTWDVYVNAARNSEGILMLRRRGLGSLERIRNGAWLKTESFKSKNVNNVDVELFGFPDAWRDTAATGRPRPWNEVTAHPAYQNADAPTQAEVRKRWDKRMEEMDGKPGEKSVLQELLDMEASSGREGGGAAFPAESIWKDLNITPDDYVELIQSGRTIPLKPDNTRWVEVELQRLTTSDGREMYRPRVLDEAASSLDHKVWRELTGDMDPVAFLNGEGNAVMEAIARSQLYDELADAGVLLHGETQSVTVERFRQLLASHVYGVDGNEPLLAFMPDGRVVIAWYDPRKSTFTVEALSLEGQGFMFHGVTSKLRAEVNIPSPFPHIPAAAPGVAAMSPTRWLVNGGQCLLESQAAPATPCTVELTPDPNGKVMRQPHPGHLEIWTRLTGWIDYLDYLASPVTGATRPWSVNPFTVQALTGTASSLASPLRAAMATDLPRPLHLELQPMTGLAAAVDAGGTVLPVSVHEDWVDFVVGDRVILDPGGEDEEVRTLTALDPITVDRPLVHDHDGGTLLVRDPDGPARPSPGGPGGPGGPGTDVQLPTCDGARSRTFPDVPAGSVHAANVGCAAGIGLLHGHADGTYRPDRPVTRAQVASILDRTLAGSGIELATPRGHGFGDVGGSVHEDAIARLAAAGVLEGRTATRFDPSSPVTRAQLASILDRTSRALLTPYPDVSGPRFGDVVGGPHQQAVDRLAAAGIIRGFDGNRFGPGRDTRRDQAATLLIRWLTDQHARR